MRVDAFLNSRKVHVQLMCAWLVPSLTELVVQARGSSLIEAATATANLSTTLTLSERHILNKEPLRQRTTVQGKQDQLQVQ